MPFVRFSRDKRGYEYVYLVEASTRNRQGPPRVLYWYRTPPGVRVGREPFDAEVRRALEERYRDVTFDWKAITSAQAPNPQIETWRERRRAKRDARRAQLPSPQALPPSAASASESRPDPERIETIDDEFLDQSDIEGAELAGDGEATDRAEAGDETRSAEALDENGTAHAAASARDENDEQ